LLVAVLVIVVLASMVALSLLFRMRAEEAAFSASAGSEQAWYAAMSGIQQAISLAQSKDPALWQNNPGALSRQLVLDDGSDKWYFTVFTAGPPEETQARFGLTDENRKLNLNKATAGMLQKCTFLSGQQIEAITGSSTTTNAVSLADPLATSVLFPEAARVHLTTLDDLLKLPGFTPGVIYGEDANHNFHLDPNDDAGALQFPPDDADGQLFLGLQDVGTVFSYEFDLSADGSARFQLNSTNRAIPEGLLPESASAYLQAAWSNKVIFKTPAELLEAKLKVKDADGKEVEITSGITAKELPLVLDKFTANFDQRRVGLINVNTAGSKVLQTIPGVSEAKAEAIAQARENLATDLRDSPAWLYSEGVLSADEFKMAAPFVTARSGQFRFNVLGYAVPSGRYRVYEVVIDKAPTPNSAPQILYLRDITKLGLPFALPSGEDTTDVQPKTQT